MSSVTHIRRSHPRTPRRRWTAKELLQRVIDNLSPDSPQPSPPLAKAAALREGALLSEYVDARSEDRVA